MSSSPRHRDVWITGIGLLSSLGEGPDVHWERLTDPAGPKPTLDETSFAPHPIHPLWPVNFDLQIPKKGDQRQMEPWQRIGTYTAGLALSDAGVAQQAELLDRTHMIVAAGGGERDIAVDTALANELAASNQPAGPFLNKRLAADLRPTLFLAQLSNLLAGSISIVHGVRGSSRTFMGEESAGADAVRVAGARLEAGQIDLALVGGSASAPRPEMMLLLSAGDVLLTGPYRPVWQRTEHPGFALGSMGAFVVLEDPGHAKARGAHGLARLVTTLSTMSRRTPGTEQAEGERLAAELAPHLAPGPLGILSGASGAEPATSAERHLLAAIGRDRPTFVRATGTMLGHSIEAQFPANIALAALALSRGGFYPPFEPGPMEAPATGPVRQILVTGFGQRRGEAMALVSAIDNSGAANAN